MFVKYEYNIRETEELDPDAAISKHDLNSKQDRVRPSLKMSSHQVSLSLEDYFLIGDNSALCSRKCPLYHSDHLTIAPDRFQRRFLGLE